MPRSVFETSALAAIAVFCLGGSALAEGISGADCARISASLKELAETNLAYAKVLQEIGFLNFELVASAVPDSGITEKISAALAKSPDLDGKVVGEGIIAFRGVCPDN